MGGRAHTHTHTYKTTQRARNNFIAVKPRKSGDCFFITGSDAGVGFSSSYLPEFSLHITVLSNQTDGNDDVIEYILNKFESSDS